MTDTTAKSDATAQAIGTLEYLDPIMLEIGDNVRDDAALSKDFLASIAENGVLVPITGIRHPDNADVVRVRNGQRRTLAAREVGLSSVPVFVLPSTAADASEETVDRIVHQIVTNDQKTDLTDAQRARGIQQMLDAGVSVTKVAKKLSVGKDTVKAAGAAAQSSAAMDALNDGQLSLTEAAALAEFADMPGAVKRLTAVAGTGRFDHEAARLREEYVSWQAEQAAAQTWRDKGFTVLDQRPRSWDIEMVDIFYLRDANGEPVAEDVVTDLTHWAVYLDENEAVIDINTGEEVPEDAVDWSTQDDPTATPEDGLRHANTVKDGTVFRPEYYCRDYAAAGFSVDTTFLRRAGIPVEADPATSDGTDTDEVEAAAAQAAALAQAEAEKAEADRRERRKVIALNRLGEAAAKVRRAFLTKLLTRKTPPKGAAIFIANCVVREPGLISDYHGAGTTAELLGTNEGAGLRQLAADLPPPVTLAPRCSSWPSCSVPWKPGHARTPGGPEVVAGSCTQ
ncbi:ParB/RepB/Spo0J family partition protein [Mycolicibacterium mageritense]|uniref:ParB/RepB/Spo0J family partition protein n=1 Tax=Mycolicibacterium mageritense TaxID=53462 RepID=UPI0023F4A1F3|nr:ParB N-terminal domain-containing protein [Mycolicibacterium mageritense]